MNFGQAGRDLELKDRDLPWLATAVKEGGAWESPKFLQLYEKTSTDLWVSTFLTYMHGPAQDAIFSEGIFACKSYNRE